MKPLMYQINDMWSESTKEQRIELLKAMGFNESWAIADSIQEIGERGGAFVAKDLIELFKKRIDSQ